MPKLLTPEFALKRSERWPRDETPRETIGCRVNTRLWRRIAEYGVRQKLRSMSEAYRRVLDDWYESLTLEGTSGLASLEDSVMLAEMNRRGYVCLSPSEIERHIESALTKTRERLQESIQEWLSPSRIRRVVEKATV